MHEFQTGPEDDEPTIPGNRKNGRVLVAEDDTPLRELLSSILRLDGYDVTAVGNADEVRSRIEVEAYDVIVTDIRMPGTSGLDLVETLRAAGYETPVIVMTAFPDDSVRRRASSLRTMLLAKPFSLESMCFAVEWMLELCDDDRPCLH